MARKKNLKVREHILKAACALLHKKGFQGVSMEDVAQSAGIKKANLFHYYSTKEELTLAVLEHASCRLQAGILRQMSGVQSPIRLVRKMFVTTMEQMESQHCCRGCFLGNLAQELSDHNEKLRKKIAAHFRFWTDHLAEIFEQHKKEGVFRKDFDSWESAEAILASLEGGILFTKTNKGVSSLRNAQKMVLGYLQSYLSGKESTVTIVRGYEKIKLPVHPQESKPI